VEMRARCWPRRTRPIADVCGALTCPGPTHARGFCGSRRSRRRRRRTRGRAFSVRAGETHRHSSRRRPGRGI
jgi:hypothetical protein